MDIMSPLIMNPAALTSIPATLNNSSLSWMFANGTPYNFNTPQRTQTTPSIVRLPGNGVWQPTTNVTTQGTTR